MFVDFLYIFFDDDARDSTSTTSRCIFDDVVYTNHATPVISQWWNDRRRCTCSYSRLCSGSVILPITTTVVNERLSLSAAAVLYRPTDISCQSATPTVVRHGLLYISLY